MITTEDRRKGRWLISICMCLTYNRDFRLLQADEPEAIIVWPHPKQRNIGNDGQNVFKHITENIQLSPTVEICKVKNWALGWWSGLSGSAPA
jgi:hypothetical protein